MDAPAPLPDPVALIARLDAEAISSRIDQLDRERQALLVLLRAARRAAAPKSPHHRTAPRKAVSGAR